MLDWYRRLAEATPQSSGTKRHSGYRVDRRAGLLLSTCPEDFLREDSQRNAALPAKASNVCIRFFFAESLLRL